MTLSPSLFRRARHADLNRLLYHFVPQKTRRNHSDATSSSRSSVQEPAKEAPQRSKKKIRDLPEFFTLPDGTRATPLGDYHSNAQAKNNARSCMLLSSAINYYDI